jgi:hypothetical protein
MKSSEERPKGCGQPGVIVAYTAEIIELRFFD